MLAGIGQRWDEGRMPPRAVPVYNTVHRLWGPIGLLVISLLIGRAWTVAALAWAGHICIDRTLGFNLRNADGTIRPG